MVLTYSGSVLVSCSKSNETLTDDSNLITKIENATDKQSAEEETLPVTVMQVINSEFADNFISGAQLAPQLGYRVISRADDPARYDERNRLYFDIDGRHLIRFDDHPDQFRDLCFRFVFPFNVNLANGNTATIQNYHQFERLIAACRLNDNCFEFDYPITLQVGPHQYTTVENNEQLRAVYSNCERDRCFRYVFPFTVTFDDGTTGTVNNYRQLKRIIADCRINGNCFEFNFPISIQFSEDEIVTIENSQQLRRVYRRCDRGDSRPNDRD